MKDTTKGFLWGVAATWVSGFLINLAFMAGKKSAQTTQAKP